MIVPCDDGLVAVFATNLDVGKPLGDHQFLFVRTFLDIDDLVVLHESSADLDGICYIAELSCTVSGNNQGVRIVILACCPGCHDTAG